MRDYERTVLVDMDGVMADFDTAALAAIPEEQRVSRSSFYVAHDYPVEIRPKIEAIYNAPGFFETLEPTIGLREAWQSMIDNGYYPKIASAPLSSNRTSIEGKIKWLDRIMVPEFGPQIVKEAVFDKNKWKYRGLALVDDLPDVPRGPNGPNSAQWEHVLYGWAHLSSVPMATVAFRLLDWRDTEGLLSTPHSIEDQHKKA